VQRVGQDGRARPEASAADISSRAATAFPVAPPTVIDTAAARRAADNRCNAAGPRSAGDRRQALLRR